MFAQSTCSSKIPATLSQRVADVCGHGFRARLEYNGFCCTPERITLSTLKHKKVTRNTCFCVLANGEITVNPWFSSSDEYGTKRLPVHDCRKLKSLLGELYMALQNIYDKLELPELYIWGGNSISNPLFSVEIDPPFCCETTTSNFPTLDKHVTAFSLLLVNSDQQCVTIQTKLQSLFKREFIEIITAFVRS